MRKEHMEKQVRKHIAIVIAVVMVVSMFGFLEGSFVHGASAAPVFRTKQGARLSYRSVTATRDLSFQIALKGKAGKLIASRKGIVRIGKIGKNRWQVTCLKPGKTTLRVKKHKGKKYRCKVQVLPYRIGKRSQVFIGHRGYAEKYPENSAIALKKAMKVGFRGVAFDLIPTRPDSSGRFDFAVSHDDSLKKMTSRKGLIRETLAQDIRRTKITKGRGARKSRQKMILLADAVDLTKKYGGIAQIEMKGNWTAVQTDRLAAALKSRKVPATWQIEAVDEGTLTRFAESQAKVGLDLELNLVVQKAMDAMGKIERAKTSGFDNIHINSRIVNQQVVDRCREENIGIGAYAGMHSDANKTAKDLEMFRLDWICVSDIPWA